MSSGLRFAICEARITRANRKDVETFTRLANVSTQRKLKPNEVKRFAFLQTQLHRQGVLVLLTREILNGAARDLYASLPWWKKLWMRARYSIRVARAWLEGVKLRLR